MSSIFVKSSRNYLGTTRKLILCVDLPISSLNILAILNPIKEGLSRFRTWIFGFAISQNSSAQVGSQPCANEID